MRKLELTRVLENRKRRVAFVGVVIALATILASVPVEVDLYRLRRLVSDVSTSETIWDTGVEIESFTTHHDASWYPAVVRFRTVLLVSALDERSIAQYVKRLRSTAAGSVDQIVVTPAMCFMDRSRRYGAPEIYISTIVIDRTRMIKWYEFRLWYCM